MRNALAPLFLTLALGLAACSAAPKHPPSVVGTWHLRGKFPDVASRAPRFQEITFKADGTLDGVTPLSIGKYAGYVKLLTRTRDTYTTTYPAQLRIVDAAGPFDYTYRVDSHQLVLTPVGTNVTITYRQP